MTWSDHLSFVEIASAFHRHDSRIESISMNLEAALLQMASLMKRRHDVHLDAATRLTPQPGIPISEEQVVVNEKLTELDRSIGRFSERCAANPALFPHMKCWMVDVAGKSEAAPLDKDPTAVADQLQALMDSGEAFAARHGSLMYTTRHLIESMNLKITDSGGGLGGWDLGVSCDDEEARKLCAALHLRFHSAISVGLMTVRRRFWGWRFKLLYNDSDAIRYLREHDTP
jgi:hypothetical protein